MQNDNGQLAKLLPRPVSEVEKALIRESLRWCPGPELNQRHADFQSADNVGLLEAWQALTCKTSPTYSFKYRAPGKTGWVYFVHRWPHNVVKIGRTRNIAQRIGQHIADCGDIQAVLICAGGRELESALHRLFKFENINGEWFWPSNFLIEAIMKWRRLNGYFDEERETA